MPARLTRLISQAYQRMLLIPGTLILVVLGYMAFRDSGILGTWRLSRMNAQIESDSRRIREENARFKHEVDDLRYNRKRIEAEARQLGYVYPGEIVVYYKLDNGTTAGMYVQPGK